LRNVSSVTDNSIERRITRHEQFLDSSTAQKDSKHVKDTTLCPNQKYDDNGNTVTVVHKQLVFKDKQEVMREEDSRQTFGIDNKCSLETIVSPCTFTEINAQKSLFDATKTMLASDP